jgi:phytanoyl-CoA hydroxylase
MINIKNNFIANKIKSLLRESIIEGEMPWYDEDKALAIIDKGVGDEWLKSKVLDMVNKGYCVVENSVDIAQIDKAIASFQAWKTRNIEELKPFMRNELAIDRIINIHNTLPDFTPLFTENKALAVQDYLFQKDTALYTSLFFEQGSTQGIHRDIPVFWTLPGCQYFGTWVALEATDAENGPLIVMAKGQKIPKIDRAAIGKEFFANANDIPPNNEEMWNRYQTEVRKRCAEMGLVEEQVHVNKGDTIIWHPLLPHGGAPIVDWKRTRHSLVVHTTPHNVPVFHQDVFFNPNKRVPKQPKWGYDESNGRKIAQTGPLSIGHGSTYDFSKMK